MSAFLYPLNIYFSLRSSPFLQLFSVLTPDLVWDSATPERAELLLVNVISWIRRSPGSWISWIRRSRLSRQTPILHIFYENVFYLCLPSILNNIFYNMISSVEYKTEILQFLYPIHFCYNIKYCLSFDLRKLLRKCRVHKNIINTRFSNLKHLIKYSSVACDFQFHSSKIKI